MDVKYFTSESVTQGHPDKICDRIADTILDEIIKRDSLGRVACEVICSTGMVMLFGEITTKCYVDMQKIVRSVLKDIGYVKLDYGFDANNCAVICNISDQSRDIAAGMLKKGAGRLNELKAGDQGLVFGYACNETKEFMPLAIKLAHSIARRLDFVRKEGIIPYLRPDGKTQVTVKYVDGKPFSLSTVLVSAQHDEGIPFERIKQDILNNVILNTLPSNLFSPDTNIIINPSGRFVLGGPVADSGLTGRKLMVDSYGGYARHGGGAFSGKDPSKLDRSGAYFARYIAKNIVAALLAKRCEVQIAYAIGVAQPVSVLVDTFNTGVVPDSVLQRIVREMFDFRPAAIIEKLNLLNPIYSELSSYGHFGREDLNLPWERLDMSSKLKNAVLNSTTV